MSVEERGIHNSLYRITEKTCLAFTARISFFLEVLVTCIAIGTVSFCERERANSISKIHLYLFKAFALIRIFKDVDNSFSNFLLYVETLLRNKQEMH